MPIFADSKEEIFSDVLRDLIGNSNITERSPGSKARAFAEAVSSKLGDIWSKFDINMAHAFLDGAQGKYLDYFGDMFGVTRIGEKGASVGNEDQVIKFSRSTTGTSVNIPQGTIVSTSQNGEGISYITTSSFVIASTATEAYVSARARKSGITGNTGKGTLKFHDADVSLTVTNEASILSGNGLESDENFRFRISKQVFSAEAANFTSIRVACLSVPGVADVQILPFFRGVGTFEVLVKSITPSVSSSLLENVRRNLYFTIAQGVSFGVRKPTETGISMELNVYLKEPITSTTNLLNAIKETIYDYVDNLDIGEELILNEIVQRVMSLDENIKTLGETTSSGAIKSIKEIRKYKLSNIEGGSTSEELIGDYYPAVDEKLLIELNNYNNLTSGPIAINFL